MKLLIPEPLLKLVRKENSDEKEMERFRNLHNNWVQEWGSEYEHYLKERGRHV